MNTRMKIKNNVPDTYVKRSRDFQLLCDVFDVVNMGVKFDIDTLPSLSDTSRCRDSVLTYLQHKLGLYMDISVSDNVLRDILKCFPYIIRKKGSREGVSQAICLFLYATHCNGEYAVDVYNTEDDTNMTGNYIVEVSVEEVLPHVDLLRNILRYVIPFGYKINYTFYGTEDGLQTGAATSDEVNIILVDEDTSSRTRGRNENNYPGIIHGIGTTVIRVSRNSDYVLRSDRGVYGGTGTTFSQNKITDKTEASQ